MGAARRARPGGTASASDWAAVAERWAELGLPLEEAYAHLRQADCLVLGGEEEALAAGLRITSDCGAAGAAPVARAAWAAVAGGRRTNGRGCEGRAAWADRRQLAELELVALGKTNLGIVP